MQTTHTKQWVARIATITLLFTPYFIVNHFPQERMILDFMFGEETIPFLPWTAAIYLSLFVQGIILLLYIPKELLKKAFWLIGLILLLHLTCFILVPTEFPRGLYKTDNVLMVLLRSMDDPGTCLPSTHVATSIIFSFFFCKIENTKNSHKTIFWIWTLMISISVLTTKQHYLIDVLAGMLEMGIAIWIFKKIEATSTK